MRHLRVNTLIALAGLLVIMGGLMAMLMQSDMADVRWVNIFTLLAACTGAVIWLIKSWASRQ